MAERFLLATQNPGKLRELREILSGLGAEALNGQEIEIVSPSYADVTVDVEETGSTFAENAMIKAKAYCEASGLPAIADDSGLCVDCLNGGPGVYSARYGGEGLDDAGRCRLLLDSVKGQRSRAAHVTCAVACVFPSGDTVTAEGRCDGIIGYVPMGTGGFGYDPLFRYPPLDKTFAQMTPEEKERVSHRGKALQAFAENLAVYFRDRQERENREAARLEQEKQLRELERLEEARQEEARQEEARQEEARQEEARQEEAGREEAGQEEAGREEAGQEEAGREEAGQEEAGREEAPPQEGARQETPPDTDTRRDPADLTGKQRAHLRGLANHIETILQVGKDGIGENLIRQTDEALEARELIKGRVLDNNMEYDARRAAQDLAQATRSQVVQVIGSRFILYRESHSIPKEKRIRLLPGKKGVSSGRPENPGGRTENPEGRPAGKRRKNGKNRGGGR